MFDENGLLTRTWIIFFERLGRTWDEEKEEPGTGGGGLFHRTLLLKDTATGSDVADHVTAYGTGTAHRVVGVLRKAIDSDLTVRVNLNGGMLAEITIPAATAINTPIVVTTTADITDGDVFSWDVVASDGSTDKAGVAAFTVDWS